MIDSEVTISHLFQSCYLFRFAFRIFVIKRWPSLHMGAYYWMDTPIHMKMLYAKNSDLSTRHECKYYTYSSRVVPVEHGKRPTANGLGR